MFIYLLQLSHTTLAASLVITPFCLIYLCFCHFPSRSQYLWLFPFAHPSHFHIIYSFNRMNTSLSLSMTNISLSRHQASYQPKGLNRKPNQNCSHHKFVNNLPLNDVWNWAKVSVSSNYLTHSQQGIGERNIAGLAWRAGWVGIENQIETANAVTSESICQEVKVGKMNGKRNGTRRANFLSGRVEKFLTQPMEQTNELIHAMVRSAAGTSKLATISPNYYAIK